MSNLLNKSCYSSEFSCNLVNLDCLIFNKKKKNKRKNQNDIHTFRTEYLVFLRLPDNLSLSSRYSQQQNRKSIGTISVLRSQITTPSYISLRTFSLRRGWFAGYSILANSILFFCIFSLFFLYIYLLHLFPPFKHSSVPIVATFDRWIWLRIHKDPNCTTLRTPIRFHTFSVRCGGCPRTSSWNGARFADKMEDARHPRNRRSRWTIRNEMHIPIHLAIKYRYREFS